MDNNKEKNKWKIILSFLFIVILVFICICIFNNKNEYESFYIKKGNYYVLYNSLGKRVFKEKIENYTPFEDGTSLLISKSNYYLVNNRGIVIKKFNKNSSVEKIGSLYVCTYGKNDKVIYNYEGKKILTKKSFRVQRISDYSDLYLVSDNKKYLFYNKYGKKILELDNKNNKSITSNSIINDNDKSYLSFVYRGNTYIYDGNNIEKIKNKYKLISIFKDNYVLKDEKDELRYYIYSEGRISGYFSSSECNEEALKIDNNYVYCKDTKSLYKFDGNNFIDGLSTYVDASKYSYMTYENQKNILKIKNGNEENDVVVLQAIDVDSSDRIVVINENNKYDIYNYDGKKVNNTSYKYLSKVAKSNNFLTMDKKKSYLVDKNGNIISKKYDSIAEYNYDYFIGYNGKVFDLMDANGNILVKKIKKIYDFNQKFVYMKSGNQYTIYNLKLNKEVYKSNAKAKVILNDNYYLINNKIFFENGKTLIYLT